MSASSGVCPYMYICVCVCVCISNMDGCVWWMQRRHDSFLSELCKRFCVHVSLVCLRVCKSPCVCLPVWACPHGFAVYYNNNNSNKCVMRAQHVCKEICV